MNYENTSLWQKTLARQLEPDIYEKEREFLRVEFERFRERAQILASEIIRTLPEFTVHDISHIDALWDTAELVTKGCTDLNPAEAFVLGGAFLIHDLGMGLAAFPNGIEELRNGDLWKDVVASLLKKELGRSAKPNEIDNLDPQIEKIATEQVLRQLHAQQAERLAQISWSNKNGTEIFLIDNPELRSSYGQIIGLIAYSHCWSVNELENRLGTTLGAPGNFPTNWTIDVIKLACILRIADAIQIDDRRAPQFLRAIRNPNEYSDLHWNFQQKLYQPRLERGRLVYTSKSPFSINEIDSWWVCYDTLKMIDSELKEVDSLLADTNRPRLNPVGVASIESPHRVSNLIKVDGWSPVDTKIKVTNVAKLVNTLGGKYLYGDNVTIPLRELIQNASDAIRARRLLEDEDDNFGDIIINTGYDEIGSYVEIEDNGIGMSQNVLTGPFIDFGESFWGSSLMHEELPGLESKGFDSTGKYGIGFYSVFMWGKKVSVFTKRFEKGRDETIVLEFNDGVNSRPILRKAKKQEYIKDGGTKIKIWFPEGKTIDTLLLEYHLPNLKDVILSLCPSLDCNLFLNNKDYRLIKANDWITMPAEALVIRIIGESKFKILSKDVRQSIIDFSKNMKILKDDDRRIIGRACVYCALNNDLYYNSIGGVVTVGGLHASYLNGIMGVLIGNSNRASRDCATPVVPEKILNIWASEQANLLSESVLTPFIEESCASVIRLMKGDTANLKIAVYKNAWVNYQELKKMIIEDNYDEFLLVSENDKFYKYDSPEMHKLYLNDNVISVKDGVIGLLSTKMPTHSIFWPQYEKYESISLEGLVKEIIAEVWNMDINKIERSPVFPIDKGTFSEKIGTMNGVSIEGPVKIITKKKTIY